MASLASLFDASHRSDRATPALRPLKLGMTALAAALLLSACGGGQSSPSTTTASSNPAGGNPDVVTPPVTPDPPTPPTPPTPTPVPTASLADPQMASCQSNSPHLQVLPTGGDLQVSGRLEVDVTAGPIQAGPCQTNEQFRFGSGLYDITSVVANTNGMGWESLEQVFTGLHLRQYSRAFAIESECNSKRILFISTDTGMVFGNIRLAVLDLIAADAQLSQVYGPDNVMFSATHQHQGPGGYSHHEAFNLFHFGFDQLVADTIINGIFESVKLAHANIEANTSSAPIGMAIGELLNTSINRSLPAFELNSQEERDEFQDSNGNPVDTDKRVVQLNLTRTNGSAVGLINWFGVHPTILGTDLDLVSSDHKGLASYKFEAIMNTSYSASAGADNFVAAFAQTDEGDASPNIFINERPFPDPTRDGGSDAYETNDIVATKQVAKALELYASSTALKGPVDFRFFHVQMDQVNVTDTVVLDSLNHPANLNTTPIRTCTAALGVSFGAGAEDGPAAGAEGVDCSDDPNTIAAGQAAFEQDFQDGSGGSIPANIAATAVLCNKQIAPPPADVSCQAEKPVLFIVGPPLNAEPSTLPFQLFRVGNLAILGLPWEVTTMSARRIRKTMLDVLAPIGIDTVVIAGLANDYVHYLTTREEYSSQQYEGASNTFGPWTLAAVQQESRRLALSLRDGTPSPAGPSYTQATPMQQRTPYAASDTPSPGRSYGEIVTDVPATATQGEVITAEFQAGHPRYNLKVQSSHVFVEQQQTDGSWLVIRSDRHPDLRFIWKPQMPQSEPRDPAVTGPSTAEAQWTIPSNTPPGTYRLRLEGTAQSGPSTTDYSNASRPFTISAAAGNCP